MKTKSSNDRQHGSEADKGSAPKVRLDKWLWAARFFKTRSLAKQAVDGGKIRIGNVKVKASREVSVGEVLLIRQGYIDKEVTIIAISDQRRGAPEAALLYEETENSQLQRQQAAEKRRLDKQSNIQSEGRPTKKGRRQIHKFKENFLK